jgi:hypothetical protein
MVDRMVADLVGQQRQNMQTTKIELKLKPAC